MYTHMYHNHVQPPDLADPGPVDGVDDLAKRIRRKDCQPTARIPTQGNKCQTYIYIYIYTLIIMIVILIILISLLYV